MTSFTIHTLLGAATNINILSIMYLAIDRTFPYHINAFSDIEVNHTNGAVLNIGGSSAGIRTYTNVINYTTLSTSVGATHTTFGSNLARNNIALYTSGIYTETNTTGGANPYIKFDITGQVISTDLIEVKVVVQPGYLIYRVKLGIIAYDLDNVQSSNVCTVVFAYTGLTGATSHDIPIPQTFFTSILVGLLDYTGQNSNYGLQFNWQPDFFNNKCIVNQSVPDSSASSASGGLQSYHIGVFYVNNWYCPSTHTYFDRPTHICHQRICGDGYWLLPVEPCDDGNTLDTDGCSALCQIEPDFVCLLADKKPTGQSFCKYTKNITLTFVQYQKQILANVIHLFFTLSPASTKYWNQTSITNLIIAMQIQSSNSTILIPKGNITMTFDPTISNKQIELVINYDQAIIEGSDFVISIALSNTNIVELIHLPSFSYTVKLSSGSSMNKFYNYPAQVYDMKSKGYLKVFSQCVGFASLTFLLIGFVFPVGRLIILECLTVIQVSFFSIMQLDLVPPTYDDLKYLIYSTGYFDMSQFLYTKSIQQESVYQILGLNRIIFSNLNIGMLLFIIPLLIGVIGLIYMKMCKSTKKYEEEPGYNNLKQSSHKSAKTYKSKIDFHSPHSQYFMLEFFKRTLLQSTFYGILVCGYLFWISVFHSYGYEKQTQNLIMYTVIGFLWLGFIILFIRDTSPPIRSWESFTEKQHAKIGLEDTQILTGFGQFRHAYHHVSMQKRPTYSRLQKLYIIPVLERIIFPIIIVIIGPVFLYSPAIISGILIVFMLIFPRAYRYCQNNLPFNEKKSVFCFLYQNYMLRQSFNFLSIMVVQGLILSFRILRQNEGEYSVIVMNNFTTIKLPLVLLSILAFNLLVNLFLFIWEIKDTKTMMKLKLIFAIFYFVREDKQLSIHINDKIQLKESFIGQANKKANNEDLQRKSNKTQKRISRHMKALNLKEDAQMSNAINSYVRNSLLFKKETSPFLGLQERQSPGRRPLTPKMDITLSSLAGKIVKRNSIFTPSPIKNSQVSRSLKY